MTAVELLVTCRASVVDLEAQGGWLKYQAPTGALTPELQSQLKKQKAELLSLLSAPPYVTLAPTGLVMPLPVLDLAWNLEDRGFRITTGEDGTLSVEPRHALTPGDRAALKRWESHLVALSEFCDQAEAI